MLIGLTDFADELREIGIPVSMVEVLDAADALRHVDLGDRTAVHAAMAATMVKNARHQDAFDLAFDVFFGLRPPPPSPTTELHGPADGADTAEGSSGGGSPADVSDLFEALVGALATGDQHALSALARRAVDRLSGFQPGRPVGGRYYLYRVMHRLDVDRLRSRLVEGLLAADDELGVDDELTTRLAVDTADRRIGAFRTEVEAEILRRLVQDRGPEAVSQTLRRPLVEDLDLMHATREELAMIADRIAPLARRLASRMSARRRRGQHGRLDVRRTIRRSLAHGGALLDPQWKPRRINKPELVMLCDVSGSMATFARFTMQLTYAIGHQFSNVRAFAFIDGIDEVTRFFAPGEDFEHAMARIAEEAQLIRHDGHSDYGTALECFTTEFFDAVTPSSTVIITGDARNNYRPTGEERLAKIADRARALLWINPEAKRYWDTGDSVMSRYGALCDGVFEVRTLRQLERFVESVALSRVKGLVPIS